MNICPMEKVVLGLPIDFEALAPALSLLLNVAESRKFSETELKDEAPNLFQELRHRHQSAGGLLYQRMRTVSLKVLVRELPK